MKQSEIIVTVIPIFIPIIIVPIVVSPLLLLFIGLAFTVYAALLLCHLRLHFPALQRMWSASEGIRRSFPWTAPLSGTSPPRPQVMPLAPIRNQDYLTSGASPLGPFPRLLAFLIRGFAPRANFTLPWPLDLDTPVLRPSWLQH